MRFAHFKRILRLGRLRLRGPRGAQDEFVLAAIAQNLRRLAALVARPPPAEVSCALHCVESIRAGGSKPAAPNEMIDRPCNQLTFAIKSARNGHAAVVALCLLSGCKAENISRRSISPFDPQATFEGLPSSIDKIAPIITPHPSDIIGSRPKIVALLQHCRFFPVIAVSAWGASKFPRYYRAACCAS
jgi:hypothetical protein